MDAAANNNLEEKLNELLREFFEINCIANGYDCSSVSIDFSVQPHQRPLPLKNQSAAYLFFRSGDWLRVGQTSYSQRFTSQHYGTKRAGSTFAKDIWNNRNEFGCNVAETEIHTWILENCGRANIRFPKKWGEGFSKFLEAFLHLRLNPKFEGRRQQTGT